MNNPELEKSIQYVAKFCFNDPFGKGRIRNLMYEYDCMLKRKNEEIETARDILHKQSIAIDVYSKKNVEQQTQIEDLKKRLADAEKAYQELFAKTYSVEANE